MKEKQDINLPVILDSKVVYNGFLTLKKDLLKLASKDPYEYYSLITKGSAVIILGITSNGYFVLNKEYRHPTQEIVLCCPGGYMDEHEEPLISAKREFLEETGYTADTFELMGEAYPYPGISNQKLYYVKALNAKKVAEPKLDPGEIIKTVEMNLQELKEAIHKEAIDGTLCTAFFFNNI